MSLLHRVGAFLEKAFAREASSYSFRFTGANPIVATTLVQDEGVVASVTADSDGVYTVTLNQAFKRIHATANCQKAEAGWKAQCTNITEGGTAANSFKVRVSNASDAAANPAAGVDVNMRLITAVGSGRTTS